MPGHTILLCHILIVKSYFVFVIAVLDTMTVNGGEYIYRNLNVKVQSVGIFSLSLSRCNDKSSNYGNNYNPACLSVSQFEVLVN